MKPKEFFSLVQDRVTLSEEPASLLARVLQLTPQSGPLGDELLAAGPSRRTAFLSGGDALALFTQVPVDEFLLRMGKSREWLRDKRARGWRLCLVVLEDTPALGAQPATWSGLRALTEQVFPEVAAVLEPHWTTLSSSPFAEVVGEDWRALDRNEIKSDASHALHVSAEKLLTREVTARDARLFLWHTLGVNQEFSGDGYTRNGELRGFREFLSRNLPLSQLQHAALELDFGRA